MRTEYIQRAIAERIAELLDEYGYGFALKPVAATLDTSAVNVEDGIPEILVDGLQGPLIIIRVVAE